MRMVAWLGGELACIAFVAFALTLWLRSASGIKAICRAAIIASLFLVATEATGLRPLLGAWIHAKKIQAPQPKRQAKVEISFPTTSTFGTTSIIPQAKKEPSPSPAPVWWPLRLVACGSGLVLLRWLTGQALLLQFRIKMQPVANDDLLARFQAIARRLALKRRVRLLEAPVISSPFAFGVLRPAVCLPARFTANFTRCHQDAILSHELAHVAGRDRLWQTLSTLLLAVAWWHPAVWWIHARLLAASEHHADEASLLIENGPSALAESLVALGRTLDHSWASSLLGIEGTGLRSSLAKRVVRLCHLQDQPAITTNRTQLLLVSALGTLLLSSLFLAAAAIGNPESHPPLATVLLAAVAPKTPDLAPKTNTANKSPGAAVSIPDPQPKDALPLSPNKTNLVTRSYRLPAKFFTRNLTREEEANISKAAEDPARQPSLSPVIRDFLRTNGIAAELPNAFFYNDKRDLFMLRATLTEQEKLETFLMRLPPSTTNSTSPTLPVQTAPAPKPEPAAEKLPRRQPQLVLDVHLWEMDQTLPTSLLGLVMHSDNTQSNFTINWGNDPVTLTDSAKLKGVLTRPQLDQMYDALKNSPSNTVLLTTWDEHEDDGRPNPTNPVACARILTLSGCQTQFKVVDVKSLVVGFETNNANAKKPKLVPISEKFEFGPVIDLVAEVHSDGRTMDISFRYRHLESLGYVNPRPRETPTLRFRTYEIATKMTIEDGEALVVGDGVMKEETRHGDTITPQPVSSPYKPRFLLIEPLLVDEVGNLIHP